MPKKRPNFCSAAKVEEVRGAFAAAWAQRPGGRLGLAVSGGSDSVALLRLVMETGAEPAVVTVDHGLRAGSGAEAEWVAGLCRDLGLEHEILRWRDRPETGNLQAAAREGRYRLTADWARRRGIGVVATGHTLDDQAETVLMRLARGSGIDGLAAMRMRSEREGVGLFRPLLGVERERLRAYLRGLGQDWLEDPSNVDRRFDRVKAREALRHLAPLGLSPRRLARTAAHMARAADALEAVLDDWAERNLELPPTGEARIAKRAYAGLPEELRFRLLARTLGLIAGRVYRPRFDALAPLAAELTTADGTMLSLHGCLVRAERDAILVFREPAAVAPPVPVGPEGATWDHRWRVTPTGDVGAGLAVAALGEAGLAALDSAATSPEWQTAPRLARRTTPAVWQGERLVAAPVAGWTGAGGWRAERLQRSC